MHYPINAFYMSHRSIDSLLKARNHQKRNKKKTLNWLKLTTKQVQVQLRSLILKLTSYKKNKNTKLWNKNKNYNNKAEARKATKRMSSKHLGRHSFTPCLASLTDVCLHPKNLIYSKKPIVLEDIKDNKI